MIKYNNNSIFFYFFFIKKKTRSDKILSFYLVYFSRKNILNLIKKNQLFLNYNLFNCFFINFNVLIKFIIFNYLNKINLNYLKKNLHILYEDNFLLIVTKPSNFILHSNLLECNNNLINSLLYFYGKKILTLFRFGILHRLDKNTTGLLLLFKSNHIYLNLVKQIKYNIFNKYYFSLNIGKKIFSKKIIGYINNYYKKVNIKKNIFFSITKFLCFKKIFYKKKIFFIKSKLISGRTNQLRIHFNSLRLPILGDFLYNSFNKKFLSNVLNRYILHCYNIFFFHPVYNMNINITIPLSKDIIYFIHYFFRDGGI